MVRFTSALPLPVRRATAVSTLALLAATSPALAAPTLEWSWSGGGVVPGASNVMSTPSIIDVTGDGIPEVIFGSTASVGGGLIETGHLRVLDGASGSELYTVTDPSLLINATTSVATGDIDGDGRIEIVTGGVSGNELIVFDGQTGALKWRRANLDTNWWGAPAIADMNGDGQAEIIMGRQVLDSTGNLLWTGAGGRGNQGGTGPLAAVSDVDLDGSPDVIAGNTIYDANGAIKAMATNADGYNAIGNFDADNEAEIVLVTGGTVNLYNHDMTLIWSAAIPGGGFGGAPTIADFDNDGEVEVGVAGASRYAVFETNGALKWQKPVQDLSSNRTGSSVFDFEGDGAAEVIYSDENFFYILNGLDGSEIFKTALSSCTWHEYPLVADVDNDGAAEIVAVGNTNCGFGSDSGIYVFGDDANWIGTRPMWNQHSYHVTNINLDGSIPLDEDENWLTAGLNDFRLNEYAPGEDPEEMPEPAMLALFGLGLAGLGAAARQRRKRR